MTKSANKLFTTIGIYFFLLYATVLFLFPVIFNRDASFCIKQDNLHQAYPFFNKLATSLHKGYLPVWDANTYGGKNFSGELQTGIFYPLNVLWCLLFGSVNGIDVYYLDLLVSLHYLICLIGMYRVGRVFRLPPVAAIASALVFTFTGALSARSGGQTCIFYGLTLLPWVIYFIGKYYLVQRHKKYLFFAGLIAGMEILAGHMQPFFHTLLISGIIITFYEYRDRKSWKTLILSVVLNISLLLLFAFIISLPQLYYAAQYLSQCYRSVSGDHLIAPGEKVPLSIYAYKFIINLSNVGNLFGQEYAQPDDDNIIYMGILPLFLLIIYLIRNKSSNIIREHLYLTRVLVIILSIGTLSALGYLTFFCFILYKIPFVNAVRQLGRYIILISFSASLLIGLAITYIPALKERIFRQQPTIKFYVLLALSLNALYLLLFQQKNIPVSVSLPFLLGFLFFLILMKVEKTVYIPIVAVAFICIDLYLNNVSYSSTQTAFYPPQYYRRNKIFDFLETTYGKYRVTFLMRDYSQVRRNIGDIYAIQTKFGYGATVNKPYYDFINVDPGVNSEIHDLLNIKYVLTDQLLDSDFIFKDSTEHLNLYERKNYYPRLYWKRQLGKQGSEIEMENKGSIRQLAYGDLYQKITVDCLVPDTLIISENYYPGWKCYDNQKEIAIHPASIKNYPPLFRSVALDKGHHLVEFRYNKVFYWF